MKIFIKFVFGYWKNLTSSHFTLTKFVSKYYVYQYLNIEESGMQWDGGEVGHSPLSKAFLITSHIISGNYKSIICFTHINSQITTLD